LVSHSLVHVFHLIPLSVKFFHPEITEDVVFEVIALPPAFNDRLLCRSTDVVRYCMGQRRLRFVWIAVVLFVERGRIKR
jgi:hypothetical protein